jgi:hypothetical protein
VLERVARGVDRLRADDLEPAHFERVYTERHALEPCHLEPSEQRASRDHRFDVQPSG